MSVKPRKITVEPSADHPSVLGIGDAMQQVMDYFGLLTDEGDSYVVWSLVHASAGSPFTAEGVPVDIRTNALAYEQVENHVDVIDRGIADILRGKPLDEEFPPKKKLVAIRMLNRNLNGIGRTCIDLGDGRRLDIHSDLARKALVAVRKPVDGYDFFHTTLPRQEIGSIEGRIVDIRTVNGEPAIRLKDHLTGREINCNISKEGQEEIEEKMNMSAKDVWKKRRIRIGGTIYYGINRKIIRLTGGSVKFIDPPNVDLKELRDPDFTGGLPAREYLEKLRENDFD